ncbi:hypothetical protein A2U01_0055149 [Trifolium medium]|uniref:Uncharacterized protein n=1 Tax=Trifolium medium TaxID=97028 RepID=A0A392RBH6_9FABA|nr:hypothetical protein [Trifolium medium]
MRRSTGALRRLVQKIAGWVLSVARCAGRYGVLRRLPKIHHSRVRTAARCADSCGAACSFI